MTYQSYILGCIDPAEYIEPGMWIVIDPTTGMLRRARQDDSLQRYIMPEKFWVTPDGMCEIPMHQGGIVGPPVVRVLPEGVVGYTISGQPIYDGDWFDAKMRTPGSITIMISGDGE